jgi:hypothetical protein
VTNQTAIEKLTDLAIKRTLEEPGNATVTITFFPDRFVPWAIESPLLPRRSTPGRPSAAAAPSVVVGESIEQTAERALEKIADA